MYRCLYARASRRFRLLSICRLLGISACVATIVLLAGCRRGGAPDSVGVSAASDASEVSEEAEEAEEAEGVTPVVGSASRKAIVPGTSVDASVDDPSQDGWMVEAVASQMGAQLTELFHGVDESAAPGSHDVSTVLAPGALIEMPRSFEPSPAFEGDGVLVRRLGATAKVPRVVPAATGIHEVLQAIDEPTDVHVKVKVFRVRVSNVDPDRNEATCSAYVQLFGVCREGRFQVNTTIDSVWQLGTPTLAAATPATGARTEESPTDEAEPRVRRLVLTDWEQVVARSTDGTMFADCTESVLGADRSFRSQLLPGVDSWLGTIESRLGIDIGGWQGVAIADVNGDGLEDLYCCQPGGLPNRLYLQQPDGTCVEGSANAGLDWLDSSHASLFLDFDNDGDQDAAIGLSNGVLFLSNDGQGKFSLRAQKILPAALPYSLSAADYDNDGDLDLYVCCYNRRSGVNQHLLFARPVPYHDANNGGRNVLLMNAIDESEDPQWSFRYVTKQLGLDENNRRFSYAAAWEDYDNDGDQDLYVANDFGRNNLYKNDASKESAAEPGAEPKIDRLPVSVASSTETGAQNTGAEDTGAKDTDVPSHRFHDVASEAGVEDVSPGMSVCWGDYNNDGAMDLYVSNMFSSAGNRITFQQAFQGDAPKTTRAQFQRHARGNSLFENTGFGTFRDVSAAAHVRLGRWAWGSKFVDLNNDGWQDLVVTNGFITQADSGDL